METMVMECIKLVKTDCLQPRGISVHFFCVSAGQTYTYVVDPVDGLPPFRRPSRKQTLGPLHVQHGLPPGIQMVACKADVWDPMESQTEIRDVVRRPDTKKTIDILLRDQ